MATYICTYKFTDKGITHIKDSQQRLEAARRLGKQLGGEMKQFFLLMGKRDTLGIWVVPDDETMARINLAVRALGNVDVETMRAFTEEEYRKIVTNLP